MKVVYNAGIILLKKDQESDMRRELQDRLIKKLGKNFMEKDYTISSNINIKRVRGSVRMVTGRIYTPQDREEKINKLFSIKLPK